ncbi:MAG: type II secretion system protein GspG [Myxococcota bacterium]|nr:type II secretion system protein GspG [Myxococcota bacterium]
MEVSKMKKMSRCRKRRYVAEQGMTLIEIMIVVIIMAMIATGVAVAVIPRLEKARVDSAKSDVAAIRTAVQLYLAENPGKCPSIDDLKTERYLDQGKRTTDPWDKDFLISCSEGDDPDVFSMGPDMQEGTEDDVR